MKFVQILYMLKICYKIERTVHVKEKKLIVRILCYIFDFTINVSLQLQ